MSSIQGRQRRLSYLNSRPYLSPQEENERKSIIRLEKNRKAAHNSREKKKKEFAELQRKNKQLTIERDEINRKYEDLKSFLLYKNPQLAREFLIQFSPYTIYIPPPPPQPFGPPMLNLQLPMEIEEEVVEEGDTLHFDLPPFDNTPFEINDEDMENIQPLTIPEN